MEKVELILIDICELKEEDISSIPLLTHEDLNEVNKIKIAESKIQKAVSFYLKRKYIGIDLEKEYLDITIKRKETKENE